MYWISDSSVIKSEHVSKDKLARSVERELSAIYSNKDN